MKPNHHKRVEMIELFYDLVFVYAISQATSILHHVNGTVISSTAAITFSVVVIVFINTWMVQMVYTNRYGHNSFVNLGFTLLDMIILLFMCNSFSGTLSDWFQPFVIAGGLLSFTLVLQYTNIYFGNFSPADKAIAKGFIKVLSFRSLILLCSALLPQPYGFSLAIAGVVISWLLPALLTTKMAKVPVDFHHLLERLTLLTIITFGEMIIGISKYFTLQHFSIFSIFIFVVVATLFMIYVIQFDRAINPNREKETGVLMIYLHYFIFFGLSLITVALGFLSEKNISYAFSLITLYSGMSLFLAGIFISSVYNKEQINYPKKMIAIYFLSIYLAFIIALLTAQFTFAIFLTAAVLLGLSAHFSWLFFRKKG
jgi:low temperature requirement protein LtrA